MKPTNETKELMQKLDLLIEALKEKPKGNDFAERIAELEVKIAKLWALMVTQTPAGQDKIKREIKPLMQRLKEAQR